MLSKINTGGFGYYQTIWKDNLSKIKDKFFLPPEAEVFDVNKNSLNNNFQNFSGSILAIPVSSLRNVDARGYSLERINGNFQITRDLEENAIRIKNLGYQPAFVTLKQISQKLADKSLLEETDGKNWILRQNLYIDDQVTLVIDESEVSWLKLKSDRNGFVWIKAEKGNLVINKVKITSWDEVENNFDLNIEDGRSYILKKSSGRMDILESEIAYLGYFGHPNRGNPFGGPYGISWKIEDGMFGKELLSGSMKNSQIHHNLFGFYSFGATGIEITNNKIFDNIYYGIDPHDDSNNLLIENNQVYGNGNHGIIISKRCFNNIIRNNLSFNNRYHGIMLDRNSNNNLVEKNSSIGNVDGVALYESSENVVIENNLLNNQNGVRANHFSKNNYFGGNLIENSRYAIYIYKTSLENYIFNNKFSGNKKEIRIKEDSSGVVSYEKEKSNWLENQKTKKIATKKFGWK